MKRWAVLKSRQNDAAILAITQPTRSAVSGSDGEPLGPRFSGLSLSSAAEAGALAGEDGLLTAIRMFVTAIRMFAETLQLGRATGQARDEYLQTIVNESERLTRLLNNVLDFSR
jgi:signal transduction histidine kinase